MTATILPPVDPRVRRIGPDSADGKRRPWVWRVASALLVLGALAFSREPLLIIPILFVLVVPFEKMFPRHDQRLRRPQLAGDVAHALSTPVTQVATLIVAIPLAFLSLAWLPGLALRPLVAMIPPAALPVVGLAVFDMTFYWTHRFAHEVPFLWRFHAIHHSTEDLDWISGFRNHPLDGALLAPAFVLLVTAGFSPELTGLLAIAQIVTGLFLHANIRWRLRWLHRIIITPEFHHWHHTNETDAHHANYSVFLPVWDIMFGTYFMPKNRRPEVYGVDEFIPQGLIPQLAHPLRGMGNPLRTLRHPIRSARSGLRFGRDLMRQIWRSARRPTHRLQRT